MKRFVALLLAMLLLVTPACQPVAENQRVSFDEDEAELIVNVCLDVTGSFEPMMFGADGQDGKAFKTFLQIHDRFFRNRRQDSKDRLILTRISGSKRAVLL